MSKTTTTTTTPICAGCHAPKPIAGDRCRICGDAREQTANASDVTV